MSMTYQNLITDNKPNSSSLMTMGYGLWPRDSMCSTAFATDLTKLAEWCAKWGIKINPEKTQAIIFFKSKIRQEGRTSREILRHNF